MKSLDFGDYIIDNKFIFERKTLTDFLISIKEGRFFRQSYKTLKKSTPYLLILEGTRESIKNSGMTREAVQGALIHISLFPGIPVLRSANPGETLNLMILTGKQLEKYNGNSRCRVYRPGIKAKSYEQERLKLQLLQNLPNIGHQKAIAILNEFGNLSGVLTSNVGQLTKIKSIGKKTATKIVELIH